MNAPPALPTDSLTENLYIDAAGLEAYERHSGHEFEVSKLVAGSPSDVFDKWLCDVWLAGGEQVKEGVGRGLLGSVRRVPLGVEEEILSAGLPDEVAEEHHASPRIPSICYRVRNPGPFPLERHLALVRFIDAASIPDVPAESTYGASKTLVRWTVKTEMSSACNRLHCAGLVRLIFRTALKSFLRSLASKAAKQAANKQLASTLTTQGAGLRALPSQIGAQVSPPTPRPFIGQISGR